VKIIFGFLFFLLVLGPACEKNPFSENSDKTKPEKGLTYCRFGPKITLHEEVHSVSYDACPGTVKIQGVLWKCDKAENVEARLGEFLKELTAEAKTLCEKHCESRSSSCVGSFKLQDRCGLSLEPSVAEREGPNFGCRTACDGRAFTYCSLYSAGFMPYDPVLMKPYPANCVCTNKRQ
jgi:hypothetical protein